MPSMHLRRDHYEAVLRGELNVEAILRHIVAHLGSDEEPEPGEGSYRMVSNDDKLPLLGDYEQAKDEHSRLLAVARAAREDLQRLLKLPPDRWRHRIENTRTRMRSRTFAMLLLEEAERRLLASPDEASTLATLVPIALRWTEERHVEWAGPLIERARLLSGVIEKARLTPNRTTAP